MELFTVELPSDTRRRLEIFGFNYGLTVTGGDCVSLGARACSSRKTPQIGTQVCLMAGFAQETEALGRDFRLDAKHESPVP